MAEHQDRPFLYASGELEPGDREDFVRHLPGCRECRAGLEALKSGARAAREAARGAPPELVERLLERVRAPEPPAPLPWRRGLALGTAFAAAVLFLRPRPGEPPPEWRNGLESGIARLGDDLERLDADLSSDSWSVEFDESWDRLDLRRRSLEAELAGPEGG